MGFTTAQAARIAGCTASQVSHWRRTELVVPTGERKLYRFTDLVALRVVASLLEAGLALARVRTALQYLSGVGDDLAGLRLVTDGANVWACRDDGQILEALGSGQLALFVSVDHYAGSVEAEIRAFTAEREGFVEQIAGEGGGSYDRGDDVVDGL